MGGARAARLPPGLVLCRPWPGYVAVGPVASRGLVGTTTHRAFVFSSSSLLASVSSPPVQPPQRGQPSGPRAVGQPPWLGAHHHLGPRTPGEHCAGAGDRPRPRPVRPAATRPTMGHMIPWATIMIPWGACLLGAAPWATADLEVSWATRFGLITRKRV